jgi:hypothetical protein
MNASAHDSKLDIIQKQLPTCLIEEGTLANGHMPLLVAHGDTSLCAVQVSGALLADPHLDAMELRWALKEQDIAAQVRWNKVLSLTHETLRIGDLAAITRRPTPSRAAVS